MDRRGYQHDNLCEKLKFVLDKGKTGIRQSTGDDSCVVPLARGQEMTQTWPWPIDSEQLQRLRNAIDNATICVPTISQHLTVIMVVVDQGFSEMLASYIYFIQQRAHIYRFLFITLDRYTHACLVSLGFTSFLSEDLGNIGLHNAGLNSMSWIRKGQYKFKIATMILNLNYSVLVNDLDITYLRNPFKGLESKDYDVALQTDLNSIDTLYNAGFVFFRPTTKSKRFLRQLSAVLENDHSLWDQRELNRMIFKAADMGQIKKLPLAFNEYVPGRVYKEDENMYYEPSEELLDRMYLLHHLYLDYHGKMFRMKELGLWMLDTDGYYSNKNAKYLIYENPVAPLLNTEYQVLGNAFKISKLLNRTLILPKFHCKKKRKCPASIFHVIGKDNNCHCSIYHLLQDEFRAYDNQSLITDFERKHSEGFRERLFLKHHLVPPSVKQSKSVFMLINTDVVSRIPSLRQGVERIYYPADTDTGPSKRELLKWFSPYRSVSVLRFKALYGRFDI